MKKEKPHCLVCTSFIVKDEHKPTQEYICSLFNHIISSDDVFKKVDCNSYHRRPYTCASCGAEIIGGKKVGNPLRYRSGKNKGKVCGIRKKPFMYDFSLCGHHLRAYHTSGFITIKRI